jgi:WD40 repeat protein
VTLADEAQQAWSLRLPADARLIRLPGWATLQGVWGAYDPPLVGGQVAFGADQHTMILLDGDGRLWLWDRDERAIRGRIDACAVTEQDEAAGVLATSPDGLAAVGIGSGRYCVLDLSTGKATAKVDSNDLAVGEHLGLMAARLTHGKLLTYGYLWPSSSPTKLGSVDSPERGGQLRSWDARTGARLSDSTPGGAWRVAFSPDGERFAMVPVPSKPILDELRMLSREGEVLWSRRLPVRNSVQSVVFATDDTLLATDGERLFSMSVSDGALLGFFDPVGPPVTWSLSWYVHSATAYIAVTPDGRYAVTNLAGRIALWDVAARRAIARDDPRNNVYRLADFRNLGPSRDGSMFATSSTAILTTSGLELVDAPRGPIAFMAASGDAQRVIAWHQSREAQGFDVWDAAARTLRRWTGPFHAADEFPGAGLHYEATDVAMPNDAARTAIRADNFVELREWSSGRVLWSTPFNEAAMTFSPDGSAVASIVSDREDNHPRATLRDAATGAVVWQSRLEGPRAAVLFFARDGRTVVFLDDNRLAFLDARDGSVLRVRGPAETGTWIPAGDTRALVVGGEWRTSIAAYDLETGKPIWRTDEGRRMVSDVRMVASPDDQAFFETKGSLIRRRSVETGTQLGDPIDLGPSADAPRRLALSSNGRILLVGTRRGVLLRFGLAR